MGIGENGILLGRNERNEVLVVVFSWAIMVEKSAQMGHAEEGAWWDDLFGKIPHHLHFFSLS